MRSWPFIALFASLAAGCGSTPATTDDAPPPSAPPLAKEIQDAAKDAPDAPKQDPKSPSRVLGYVEGDVVTYRDVLQLAAPELAQFADNPDEKSKIENDVLMKILRERMMYRAALDAGVKASRDEIEEERANFVKDLGRNGSTLEGYLHDHDMSRREFDAMVKTDLMIEKYKRAAVGRNNDPEVHVRPEADIYVAPQEVTNYYERHPERYHERAAAKYRILLVKADRDAKDREAAIAAARAKADAVLARLKQGEDWVPVYRDATKGAEDADPNDGLVEIHRGEMIDWIEKFAFTSEKGTLLDPVKQAGTTFYVMRAEGSHDERVVPFEEAAPGIRRFLFEMKATLAWLEVQLVVLDRSSIEPESLRTRLRDDLRAVRQKMLTDAGL